MNIFYLDHDQTLCSAYHVDKHCVKMIVEYAQLLSTAQRFIDGEAITTLVKGKPKVSYVLDNEMDSVYKLTHINHPSAVWARQSNSNYNWLHGLLVALCKEYTYRYEKIHKCERDGLVDLLSNTPKRIQTAEFTQPTPAMPDEYRVIGDSLLSYRQYYNAGKRHLFSWKKRETPNFITSNIL